MQALAFCTQGRVLLLVYCSHEQVQPTGCSGFGEPQFAQNFPVFSVPHEHFQLSAAGFGSGLGYPQFAQNFPVFVVPQAQVQPFSGAAFVGAAAGAACCGAASAAC